jgi:hypothetical protein
MKPFLIIACVCLFACEVKSQQKENATKEQTIEYLNQKAKEIIGFNKVTVTQKAFLNKRTVSDAHLRKTANGIELYVVYHTPEYTFFTYTSFNPKHIISITNTSKDVVAQDSPIGTFEIKFIGKTALFNNNGDSSTVERTTFNFLQSDPANGARILNALTHLKNLYKADDALFEN